MALLPRAVFSVVKKQESLVDVALPAIARYLQPHRSMSVELGLKSVQDYAIGVYLPKGKALQFTCKSMDSIATIPHDAKVPQFGSKCVLDYAIGQQHNPQGLRSLSFSSDFMGSAMSRLFLRSEPKGRYAHVCTNQWTAKRNLSLKRNIKFSWKDDTNFSQQQTFLRWESSLKRMARTIMKNFILPTKEFLMNCIVFLSDSLLAFVRLLRRGFEAKLVDFCFTYFVLLVFTVVLYIVDKLTGKLGIFVDPGEESLLKLAVKALKEVQDMKRALKEDLAKRLSVDDLILVQQNLLQNLKELKATLEYHSMDDEKRREEILSRLDEIESKLKEVMSKENDEVSKEASLDNPKDADLE